MLKFEIKFRNDVWWFVLRVRMLFNDMLFQQLFARHSVSTMIAMEIFAQLIVLSFLMRRQIVFVIRFVSAQTAWKSFWFSTFLLQMAMQRFFLQIRFKTFLASKLPGFIEAPVAIQRADRVKNSTTSRTFVLGYPVFIFVVTFVDFSYLKICNWNGFHD